MKISPVPRTRKRRPPKKFQKLASDSFQMPLLVLTGYPCSGKSTIAQRLKDFMIENGIKDVSILDDYFDSEYEKVAAQYTTKRRLTDHNNCMRSEVLRRLSSNNATFLIVDALNYARSQRYELFTVAKNMKTTFGILFCDTDEATSSFLNSQKDEPYTEELIKDLVARYERPNSRLSGEKPLFEVVIRKGLEDDLDQFSRDVRLPFDDIYDCLILAKPLKENASVSVSNKTSTCFMQEVDKATQAVTKQILASQGQAGIGGLVVFPWEPDVHYQVKKIVSLPVLMRYRTQFLDMTRKSLVQSGTSVTKIFVDYLKSVV
uniref:Protein KTI12 homolog n=1 Tax=Bursaphelenchus xylophilus TaxID=6326 RepID=A0A1I7STE2_BURXY